MSTHRYPNGVSEHVRYLKLVDIGQAERLTYTWARYSGCPGLVLLPRGRCDGGHRNAGG